MNPGLGFEMKLNVHMLVKCLVDWLDYFNEMKMKPPKRIQFLILVLNNMWNCFLEIVMHFIDTKELINVDLVTKTIP